MKTFKILLFTLALSFLLPIAQTQAAFSDLPESHHHYFPLSLLEFEEIIQGYADGTVRPGNPINRAELIKILVEGLGLLSNPSIHSNCFPDVRNEWFAEYICFAQQQGWVDGYPDGTFKPGQTLNKVEALKIILNAFGISAIHSGINLPFNDTPQNEWYSPFLVVAVQKNLLEETGGKSFNPSYLRSRGEVAEMVARIIMIQHMNDPSYNTWIKAEFRNYLLLHKLRRENGVTERLKLNPTLTKVARAHAKDMGDNIKELSHGSSDGIRQSFDRIKDAIRAEDDPNFSGRTGENIGGGSKWAKDPFDMIKWVHDNIFMPEEPDVCNHRTSLLSQCLPFTEVGIGVYTNAEGQSFFVNDFITRVYADTMSARAVLDLPSEYTSNPLYEIVQNELTAIVHVGNCNGVRVRGGYFIQIGVYKNGSQCGVYDYSYSRQPKWEEVSQYRQYEIMSFTLSSSWYTAEQPTKKTPFIEVTSSGGWEIVGGALQNTAYLDTGEEATVFLTNNTTGGNIQFRLDMREEGWVIVSEV